MSVKHINNSSITLEQKQKAKGIVTQVENDINVSLEDAWEAYKVIDSVATATKDYYSGMLSTLSEVITNKLIAGESTQLSLDGSESSPVLKDKVSYKANVPLSDIQSEVESKLPLLISKTFDEKGLFKLADNLGDATARDIVDRNYTKIVQQQLDEKSKKIKEVK